MQVLLRLAAFAVALLLASAAFADKSFVQEELTTDVVRLPASLRKEAGSLVQRPAAQLVTEALGALSHGDPRHALDLFGAAVAVDDKNAAAWLGYARAAFAIVPRDSYESFTLRGRALAAAYGSYQRAPGPAE